MLGQAVTKQEQPTIAPVGPAHPEAPSFARLRALVSFHPGLVVVGIACAALVRQAMHSGLAGDVFYEVASGRWMLAHHALLRHDVFTYSVPGRPWLDEEWGYQVLLAWLVAHLGPVAYWLVSGGACAGAVVVGVALCRRAGAGWLWAAALAVLAATGLSVGMSPRPQDLSYLFFALLLLFLSLARDRAAWLLAAPPLMLVWANVHGSFLLGLALLALEVVWSVVPAPPGRLTLRPLPRRPIALCLAAGVLASFANPNGPRLLVYAFGVSTSPQLTSLISEWQSPDFHSLLLLVVIIGPVILLLASLALGRATLNLAEVVLAMGLFVATLHAVRFTPYFDLAACTALARWQALGAETLPTNVLSAPAALVVAAALLAGPHLAAGTPQVTGPLGSPVAATNYLAQHGGRVFTTYWWGDYLDYRGIPVFVDGRTDMYSGTTVLSTYMKVEELEVDPDRFFSRWGIRWVMWQKGTALSTYLAHDARWAKVFAAQGAVVFEHRGPW
jgi:hypothetical protein